MIILSTLLLSSVTVTLPTEAAVLGSEITLGEIAVITGAEPEELTRLQAFTLGYAPTPGYSRVLQDWKIQRQLSNEFTGVEFNLLGSRNCRVLPKVATVEAHAIEHTARTALGAMLSGQDIEVKLISELSDESVPQGLQGRELNALPQSASVASSQSVTGVWSMPVQILVDGTAYRTVWVDYNVTIFQVMPVLARSVLKGQPIQAGDIVMKRARLVEANSERILGVADLMGSIAKRSLSANTSLTARDVTRAMAFKRGETVAILVRKGAIRVETYGVALTDAFVGERAVVRLSESQKEITVQVTAKGQGQVVLPH
jgi:flagella basal body P-ring formation protein FlgA